MFAVMLQEVGMDEGAGSTTGEIKANLDAAQVRTTLVRLYFHPHDARTLHLSFDV